MDLAQSI